jgi:hypothetical protein
MDFIYERKKERTNYRVTILPLYDISRKENNKYNVSKNIKK